MSKSGQSTYLSDEVKRFDYDRWLTTLYGPPAVREAIFSVLAFHAEIARIRETVSEPLLGDIRLQWWRDTLSSIAAGAVPAHPVAEALAKTIPNYQLNIDDFRKIIDARSRDMDPVPFNKAGELLEYADQTGGILNTLILQMTGETSEDGLAAARQVGKAYALTGIIRAIPYHVAQDVLRIPTDVITAHGLTADNLFTSKNREVFFGIMKELTSLAGKEQEEARLLIQRRPKTEKAAYRLASLTSLYLKRLKSVGYDPAHDKMNIGALRKIIALSTGY